MTTMRRVLSQRTLRSAPRREFGRLIRVTGYRGDENAIGYLVAVSDAAKAIELLRSKLGASTDQLEDGGPVSGDLIKALGILPGEFIRTDDVGTA